MSSNRAPSPSILLDCKLPPSAYTQRPADPIIYNLDDSDCEEVQLEADDEEEIEFLGYLGKDIKKEKEDAKKSESGGVGNGPIDKKSFVVDDWSKGRPSSTRDLSSTSNSKNVQNTQPRKNSAPLPPPPPRIRNFRETTESYSGMDTVDQGHHSDNVDHNMDVDPPAVPLNASAVPSLSPRIREHIESQSGMHNVEQGAQSNNEYQDPAVQLTSRAVPPPPQKIRQHIASHSRIDTVGQGAQSCVGDQDMHVQPPAIQLTTSNTGNSGNSNTTSANEALSSKPIPSNFTGPRPADPNPTTNINSSTNLPSIQIALGQQPRPKAITIDYGDGQPQLFLSANCKKPNGHVPRQVTGSCQTGDSIINGEFTSKNISVDVTASRFRENKRVSHSNGRNNPSDHQEPKSSSQHEEKRKRRHEETTNSSKSRCTEMNETFPGSRSRHPSREQDPERRHDQYMKAQDRRYSAKDTERNDIPTFKTEDDLIILIRSCYKCNSTSNTRSDGVSHQKHEHNLKHCPVCFKLLSYSGNIWKDHLTSSHSIGSKEMAKCPFCKNDYNFEGMYIHISKVHLVPKEITLVFPPTLSPNVSSSASRFVRDVNPQIPASTIPFSKSKLKPTSSQNNPRGKILHEGSVSKNISHSKQIPCARAPTGDSARKDNQAATHSKSQSSPPSQTLYSAIGSNCLTIKQLQMLKIHYVQNNVPGAEQLKSIAVKIGASDDLVKKWFLTEYKQQCANRNKKK